MSSDPKSETVNKVEAKPAKEAGPKRVPSEAATPQDRPKDQSARTSNHEGAETGGGERRDRDRDGGDGGGGKGRRRRGGPVRGRVRGKGGRRRGGDGNHRRREHRENREVDEGEERKAVELTGSPVEVDGMLEVAPKGLGVGRRPGKE